MPIISIAKYTLKEYIKEKVLLVVFVFLLLLMASSYVLSPLAVGAQKKIVVDLGLASVSLFGVLLVILLGAGSYYREKEKGILTALLSKPISRVDFLLGKYLGMMVTVLIVMVLMSGAFMATMLLDHNPITGNILWAIYLSMLEVGLLAAVMIFFTMFTSPVLSSFFTIAVFVSGHLSKDILAFGSQIESGVFKLVAKIAFYVLPNLALFNARQEAVHGLSLPHGFIYSASIYGIFYTLFMLLVSAMIFREKEVA